MARFIDNIDWIKDRHPAQYVYGSTKKGQAGTVLRFYGCQEAISPWMWTSQSSCALDIGASGRQRFSLQICLKQSLQRGDLENSLGWAAEHFNPLGYQKAEVLDHVKDSGCFTIVRKAKGIERIKGKTRKDKMVDSFHLEMIIPDSVVNWDIEQALEIIKRSEQVASDLLDCDVRLEFNDPEN